MPDTVARTDSGHGHPGIRVHFLLDEAYSLFPGGDSSIPVGGAGATTYHLAEEIAKDERFLVSWLFTRHVPVSRLHHPTIRIARIPRARPRWLAQLLVARLLGGGVSSSQGHSAVIGSTWTMAWPIWDLAANAGAKMIVRIASDADVGQGGSDEVGSTPFHVACSGSSRAVDGILFQTAAQQQQFLSQVACPTAVIPKGWPIPDSPTRTGRGDHILWVASARALKQPELFLRLAEMLPDEHFYMVVPPFGGVSDEVHKAVLDRAATLPNVTVESGQISLAAVDDLMARAKLFVNTSRIEGFPTTFLQAAAAGVPVASLSADPDGMIARNGLGVVADGSFHALLAGIRELLEPGANLRAGYANWQYAYEHHNVSKSAEVCKEAILRTVQE